MIYSNHLRELIIKSTLNDLMLCSKDAEELLIFTCAVESKGGTYLKQLDGGPALGIYQMEPHSYIDIWEHTIKSRPRLMMMVTTNFDIVRMPDPERMIYDLRYATLMARLFYARINVALPAYNDVEAIWDYYKYYYNTNYGKAEKAPSIAAYLAYLKA